jgi:hypothetical protein
MSEPVSSRLDEVMISGLPADGCGGHIWVVGPGETGTGDVEIGHATAAALDSPCEVETTTGSVWVMMGGGLAGCMGG